MSHAAALVLDLDGTLYRGDAPLLAYAEAMAVRAGSARGETLMAKARAFLADPLDFSPYRDPWATMGAFGGEAGLSWPRRDEAFLEVREAVMQGGIPIDRTPGLEAFIDGLDRRVRVVVLTNSDEESARRLLAFLGLGALAPYTHGVVGKPKGFAAAVRRSLGGVAPGHGVSVGDNHTNDIEPARALGLATLHVRWPGAYGGLADHTVARFEDGFEWLDGRLDAVLRGWRPAAGEEEAWA